MIEDNNSFRLTQGAVDDDAENSLKQSMARLEKDFCNILVNNTVPLDATNLQRISTIPSLDGVNSQVQGLNIVNPAAISELKEIADCMIQSGYEKECCLVYSSIRGRVLDESLIVLGIESYGIEELQDMEGALFKDQMRKWIQALKIMVKLLLTAEKVVCEQVFAGSELMREICFVESAKGCVMKMLDFGQVLAICKTSSEKLFSISDIYDTLSDVTPDLEELFNGDSGAGEIVCGAVKGVLEKFRMTIIATFEEFERGVHGDSTRNPEDGDIHPLTRDVMEYMKVLVDYSEILNGVVETNDYNSVQLQNVEVEDMERMPCITRRLLSVIASLESNLEEKSRMYEDGGLQYVFMMNNVLYIVNRLKVPEVRNMLGDRCISKMRDHIREYAISYLRCSWTKTLYCLRDTGKFSPKTVKKIVKVRLKIFMAYFKDTYRIQTAWKIADPQLREELRILISEKLIPLYRSFIGRFSAYISTRSMFNIAVHPDDLLDNLSDLFEGIPRTLQRRMCNLC